MLINGQQMQYNNLSIAKLLNNLNLSSEKVVVEVNKQIIAKQDYSSYLLYDKDTVEIISFVGGG